MKNWFACAVVLAMLVGCSKKKNDPGEIVPPEPELRKEEVMTNLSWNPYQMAEWYAVSGKDTTFLNQDPYYGALMKSVFLIFVDDKWVEYYFGESFPNTDFLGKAETFSLNIASFRPLHMNYGWEEKEGTMFMKGFAKPDGMPYLFPDGVTLRLDKKGYSRLKTFEQAKATRTTGFMRFYYEHEGKNYTLLLKQMWAYKESVPKRQYYVVF